MPQDTLQNPFGAVDQQPSPAQLTAGMAPQPSQSSSGGNPFTDVLNHVTAFNTALTGTGTGGFGAPATPTFAAGSFAPATTSLAAAPQLAITPPETPIGGGLGGPLKVGLPSGETPSGTPTGGAGGQVDRRHPSLPTPPPAKPPGATYTDWAWQKANEWGNVPGYGYLLNNPTLVDLYQQWVAQNNGTGVDVVDWLKHMNLPSPQAGRQGYDTYAATASGAATPWASTQPIPYIGQQPPTTTPPPTTPPPTTPPPTTPPPTTPPPTTPPPTTPPPTTPPGTTPAVTPPPAPPPAPAPVPPPVTTPPPPVTPPPTPSTLPTDEIQKLIDQFNANLKGQQQPDVETMMNPMFARQRQLLQQQLQAQAALTPGRTQSGGFAQTEGQALSDLSGQQSATLAGALQQQALAKMQQNTALMQLSTQAGMQKYTADINADIQKFGIKTNADLQAWLDSSDNALKKYGIDTSTILGYYQSQLALQGQQYSANAGLDAAALYAAATRAATDAQLQLGTAGLNVTRENNIGNFILGLLGLGNVDINSLNAILSGIPTGTVVVKNP